MFWHFYCVCIWQHCLLVPWGFFLLSFSPGQAAAGHLMTGNTIVRDESGLGLADRRSLALHMCVVEASKVVKRLCLAAMTKIVSR